MREYEGCVEAWLFTPTTQPTEHQPSRNKSQKTNFFVELYTNCFVYYCSDAFLGTGIFSGVVIMGRRPANGPTGAELEILGVLWDIGPATVRQVNEKLNSIRPTGKTTTLKLMQIMAEKGLVVRDESVRPQIFRPKAAREVTQSKLVGDLLKRAFDGSAGQLILRALATKQASPKELAEIRKLLDEMEGDQQ